MMWGQRVNALIARDTGKNSARNFADTPVMWAPASRACPDVFCQCWICLKPICCGILTKARDFGQYNGCMFLSPEIPVPKDSVMRFAQASNRNDQLFKNYEHVIVTLEASSSASDESETEEAPKQISQL